MVGSAGDRGGTSDSGLSRPRSTMGDTGRRPGVPRTPASRGRPPGHACTRASTASPALRPGGPPRMGPAPRHPRSPASKWNGWRACKRRRARASSAGTARRTAKAGDRGVSGAATHSRWPARQARAGHVDETVFACPGGRPREERRTIPPGRRPPPPNSASRRPCHPQSRAVASPVPAGNDHGRARPHALDADTAERPLTRPFHLHSIRSGPRGYPPRAARLLQHAPTRLAQEIE